MARKLKKLGGREVTHIADGTWYKAREFDVCCDCGLVHRLEYAVRKGEVWFKAERDNDLTEVSRLKHEWRRK